jgi:hypothetical protein
MNNQPPEIKGNNYNGRVNIANKDAQPQWPLFQQNNNGVKNYKEEALRGIQSDSTLSQVFFSKQNIDLIQNQIRYNVWIKSNKKHIIGRQSDTELEIVMRSIYLQYSKNLQYNIKEQIEELNSMILKYCIPNILSEVEQYLSYKQNVSSLPQPMERPQSLSSAGSKTLELKNFF